MEGYRSLERCAIAFRHQNKLEALAKVISLSILDLFLLEEISKYVLMEVEELFRPLSLSSQDVSTLNLVRDTCFLVKLLQDFSALHTIFIPEDASYCNLNDRTTKTTTANTLSWMSFVLFKRNNGDDMFNMLRFFYEANNLFLNDSS